MAQFPALKTGALAQYPSDRTRRFPTRVLRFLDGSEQRFRAYGPPLRAWTLRLDLLDEAELYAIGEFFAAHNGRGATFSFADPIDGTVYPNCSFAVDNLELEQAGAGRGRARVFIRENRT